MTDFRACFWEFEIWAVEKKRKELAEGKDGMVMGKYSSRIPFF
jgi:hypothetical protein